MFVVQITLQPEIYKVDVYLNRDLIVGDSGVGNTDFCGVAEICIGAVFPVAEVRNQVLCPVHRRFRFFGLLAACCLCLRLFVRIVPNDGKIPVLSQIVNGSAVIRKAVAFHCAVHITLCGFFRFFQCLIVPFFIKAVFKAAIRHDLIRRCHPVGIIINRFFRQPFRLLGERVIQLPHFDDLRIDAACPQMLFHAVSCSKEVFTVCPQPV